MLKQETISHFLGFGDNKRKGEYFYSQGMRQSYFGIKPDWKVVKSTDSDSIAALTMINWFVQRIEDDGNGYNFGIGADGKVFKSAQATPTTWAQDTNVTLTGYGNGLGVDTNKNIIFAGKQHIGKITSASPNVVTNEWKDLGADETTMWRPIERYEDTTLIGNKNYIATYTGDGSDFNAQTIGWPAGFVIRCIKSGNNGILIGMNFGNFGVLALWDNFSDRAITPWIWFEEPIYSIAKFNGQWIVAVGDKFVITNGYTSEVLTGPPDSQIQTSTFIRTSSEAGAGISGSPGCMMVKDNYLIVGAGIGLYNRQQQGIWIYNLDTGLWNFCAVSNGVTYGVYIGGIAIDNNHNLHVSYQTTKPATKYIGRIYNAVPPEAHLITSPLGKGNNKKTGECLILNLAFDTVNSDYAAAPTWSIVASIYDFKRQLWTSGTTRAVSTDKSVLKVDGSSTSRNKAEVGDEVTILNGANAGEIRHIESIANKGTDTEEWTVDSDFSNLTESGVTIITSPFQKIGTISVATPEIKENYYYLPIQQAPTGKKFLIKVYITATDMVPEISDLTFVYDDLGHI